MTNCQICCKVTDTAMDESLQYKNMVTLLCQTVVVHVSNDI